MIALEQQFEPEILRSQRDSIWCLTLPLEIQCWDYLDKTKTIMEDHIPIHITFCNTGEPSYTTITNPKNAVKDKQKEQMPN